MHKNTALVRLLIAYIMYIHVYILLSKTLRFLSTGAYKSFFRQIRRESSKFDFDFAMVLP